MNCFKKKIVYFIYLLLIFLTNLNISRAALLDSGKTGDLNPESGSGQTSAFVTEAGFTTATIGSVMAYVVQGFLGLLGMIFIILILIGGYDLMTAGGEEEKVTKAKDTIKRAVIGLLIIIGAYSITYFVFTSLSGTGAGGGGSEPL